ncbi:peptide-methionine (S)-S-oxide reductase [Geosmithia morbida]|uniref:peptide-methionine (S)-S-oxide reductase n=1 Tax=Geosmithia morbida TaxID=1094350 RepID=A0A9P4YXM8_9HYPO|nr:peptide-methionine (S)-S-oxide reductase [Geosmithia morbida]KAF4124971.1 peptide-methionine (S)-S-oxide reductase [Geosmithia morbida]
MPLSNIARLFRSAAQPTTTRLSAMSNGADASAAPGAIPEGAQRCTVAAGCFWGTDHLYRKKFTGKGLLDAKVGYIGGDVENPTYRLVCGGKSGHAEALQVIFDPKVVTYAQLLDFFYRSHDPTTLNAQGPDTGPQYRSAIFYHDPDQERTAREVTRLANEKWWGGRIVTDIAPAGKWWTAEDYHQEYLHKNPAGYECPSHFIRQFPPLDE